MSKYSIAEFEARARVFKALGHPTRLFIVHQLADGEKCVCELTELIGSDMSTVSRHLSQLREAGILEQRKQGAMIFYRLRTPCVLSFFECVENVVGGTSSTPLQIRIRST